MKKHFSIRRIFVRTAFMVLLMVFWADMAAAHRVVVFGWIEGDSIFTESRYPDGKRVKNGQIIVYDAEGKDLLTGTTSDDGEFSFKIPKISELRIVIQAGMGHQGEWKFSQQEIQAAAGAAVSEGSDTLSPIPPEPAPVAAASAHSTDGVRADGRAIDPLEIEQVVSRVLDQKLQPITRMLAEMQNKGPTITDIFGGIVYIIGLMGVAAYFLSQKNNKK